MDLQNKTASTSDNGGAYRRSVPVFPEPESLTKCVSMVEPNSQNHAPSSHSNEDDAVIAAPVPTVTHSDAPTQEAPAQIPLEDATPSTNSHPVANKQANEQCSSINSYNPNAASIPPHEEATHAVASCKEEDEESDWGDEDSYEYEEDDDVAFSGFLAPPPAASISCNVNSSTSAASQAGVPARILDEESQVTKPKAPAAVAASLNTTSNTTDATESNRLTEGTAKRKWKEPTRAAVNMSLRAQSETTGGKRRLAQDLYRIMNQDTEEAGFSLQPQSEDSMDKWTIKLFQFDEDSNLAKDMKVVNTDHIELEMSFPDQYPFEPPFVRVVRPRFKKQTGFVMNGALCMELLTKDGWNPINDIESVIVSVRSLLVVGDGRLDAAAGLPESRYQALLEAASAKDEEKLEAKSPAKEEETIADAEDNAGRAAKKSKLEKTATKPITKAEAGSYTAYEAQSAYSHLSDYHKKKGWDTSGWWARKG